jgi:parallel beta-helix repeat protein
MSGSNHNRIVGNTLTHSGDGYFLSRSQSGPMSGYNLVAFNDGSHSPHNAFESTFSAGDEFLHNTADQSGYGFWLSFSTDTTVVENHIEGSKFDGIAIEHGQGNSIERNRILSSGKYGIRLFNTPPAPDPNRDYAIVDNEISLSPVGILFDRTSQSAVTANLFDKDGVAVELTGGSSGIGLRGNRYTGGTPSQLESTSESVLEAPLQ